MSVTLSTIMNYETTSSGAPFSASDDFSTYSDGPLAGNSNWVQGLGTINVTEGSITPGSAGAWQIVYWNESTDNDQWSQVVVSGNSTRRIGVAVRCNNSSGGNGYIYTLGNGNAEFGKIVNGSYTQIATDADSGEEATIKISVTGTTISCYFNGSLHTGLTGGTGQFTDSDLSSGYTGVSGYDTTAYKYGNTWTAGDV